MDDISDLLNQSDQLTDSKYTMKDLEAVYEQSKKMSQKFQSVNVLPGDTSKGDFLLARSGFDVEKYRRGLSMIELKPGAFEMQEPLSQTDIEGYLKHEHNMIILTAIEECKKITSNEFYSVYSENLQKDWNHAKTKFLNLLKSNQTYTDPHLQDSMIDSELSGFDQPLSTPGRRSYITMSKQERDISALIFELNRSRAQKKFFPIIQSMLNVLENLETLDENKRREVTECWKVMKDIFQEENASKSGKIPPYRPNRYQGKFMIGAQRYLQDQYFQHIKEYCAKNLFEQSKQENPMDLIKAYVSHRFKKSGMWPQSFEIVNNYPVWVLIFYLLRCGFDEMASQVAQHSRSAISESMLTLINNQGPVNANIIKTEYQNCSQDSYKKAIYLVIGKCDPEGYISEVFSKIEDFLWLKFRTGGESGLKSLQDKIYQLGHSYFCPHNGHSLLYFKILLFTQQFERAIHYLCGRDIQGYSIVEAVHFAIAMDYYGVLQTSDDVIEPLLSVKNGLPCLNYPFLIKEYVRKFAHTSPQEAVSYYCLIRNDKIRLNCLKELVIESKDTEVLLGKLDSKNTHKRGIIQKLFDMDEVVEILKLASQEYDRIGRYDQAVNLYFMAFEEKRNPDYLRKVLMIMNKELSRVLAAKEVNEEVSNMASKVKEKLCQIPWFGNLKSDPMFDTFEQLRELNNFFLKANQRYYQDALQIIEQMNLLPFNKKEIEARHSNFKSEVDPSIKRNMSNIIKCTMEVLYQLWKRENEKSREISSMKQRVYVHSICEKAKNLITFASYIQVLEKSLLEYDSKMSLNFHSG